MGSPLLRRLGRFECETDPRWEEEYKAEKAEKEAQDRRYRQYKIERLFFSLWGIESTCAEMLACAVYGEQRVTHSAVRPENMVKLIEYVQ